MEVRSWCASRGDRGSNEHIDDTLYTPTFWKNYKAISNALYIATFWNYRVISALPKLIINVQI